MMTTKANEEETKEKEKVSRNEKNRREDIVAIIQQTIKMINSFLRLFFSFIFFLFFFFFVQLLFLSPEIE